MKTEKLNNNLTFKDTAQCLEKIIGDLKPDYLVILGSGLNTILDDIKKLYSIPYSDIDGIATSSVSGHKGILEFCEYNKKIIAIMRGRLHTYEGHTCDDVVRLPRAIAFLGAKFAILTNAAGSTSLKHCPGDLLIITDHINMTALSPLGSAEAKIIGEQFIDMTSAYLPELIKQINNSSKKLNIKIKKGIYAWMKGPQYETASEIKMLHKLGANVVGMSTVPEVIALHHLKIKIACITTVTNYGTGVKKGHKLTHKEVKETGLKLSNDLNKIIKDIIKSHS